MRILEITFSTELGKSKTIRVYNAKAALTGAEVAAAMDNIVAKNIFSGTGGEITGKVKAQVVTTSTADVSLV
ncbi:MAG TPA: DUF2922 domain-containing protein [Syntrophomonadaceae bacterium]|nr:DUF2922 domain-containing protein [Syntrophomonadaceae bacterium]